MPCEDASVECGTEFVTGFGLSAFRRPLSDAETRVLRYLPSSLSVPEIAGELYLSVNTIRTHLRHIYAKLEAHGRAEAVVRARELGLLAPGARLR